MTSKNCLTGLTIVATLVALISIPTAYFQRQARRNAQCVHNLELIGAALRAYASTAKGPHYPVLSLEPGRVMFRGEGFYPEYLKDAALLISPLHPQREELQRLARQNPLAVIDDHSYWYPGYVFSTQRSALSWIADYKKALPQGVEVSEGFEHEGVYVKSGPGPLKADEREMLLHDAFGTFSNELFRFELRDGIERFFVSDISTPAPPPVRNLVPVMFERPELHGNGGHVLYMDGHVEFVPYPGPFPMAKDFIEGLRSLDKLEK